MSVHEHKNVQWCTLLLFAACFCLSALSTAEGGLMCDEGWHLHYDTGRCIKFFTDKKNWQQARQTCLRLGGDLLKIESKQKEIYINNLRKKIRNTIYIGLIRYTRNKKSPLYKKFFWLDETVKPSYTNWDRHQPDNAGNKENCAQFNPLGRPWNDVPCTFKAAFACETNAFHEAPVECEQGWYQFNDQCLRMPFGYWNWQKASNLCQSEGGYIASVDGKEIQNFISKFIMRERRDPAWIGLHRMKTQAQWLWADTTKKYKFQNWSPRNSSTQDQNCVQILGAKPPKENVNKWYATYCNRARDVICQKAGRNADVLCQPGWDLNSQYKTCVKRFHQGKSWEDARANCKSQGGDLVKIPDATYQTYIRNRLGNSRTAHWLGIHQVANVPVWLDEGTQAQYTAFDQKQMPTGAVGCGYVSLAQPNWREIPCNGRYPYFCQKPPFASISCPDGYTPHIDEASCLKMSTDFKTWEIARQGCREDGGDLIVIENKKQNDFIKRITSFDSNYWIGLHDRQKDNHYRWLDSTSDAPFTLWNEVEPDDKEGSFNCVRLKTFYEWWSVDRCSRLSRYICQHPATLNGKKPDTSDPRKICRSGWSMYKKENTCVKYHSAITTWQNARDVCKKEGGDLVKIQDKDFAKYLTSTLKQQVDKIDSSVEPFIGINNLHTTSQFKWLDEEDGATYTQWVNGVPTGAGIGSCGVILTPNMDADNFKWDTVRCTDSRNFICQEPTRLPGSLNCGVGWEDSTSGDHCYRFNSEKLNRNDASFSCINNGGLLLSVPTSKEMFYLMGRMNDLNTTMYWSGGSKVYRETGWNWIDNEPFAFMNWDAGEPNANVSSQCLAIDSHTGRWSAISCRDHLPSICKKKAFIEYQTTTPSTTPNVPDGKKWGCPSPWSEFKDSCYIGMVAKTGIDWKGANKECQQNGASLVSIKDRSENNFVFTLLPSDLGSTWIGLNDLKSQYTFDWTDIRTSVTYTNWNFDQPVVDGTDSVCGQIRNSNGKWEVQECTNLNDYLVCKREKSMLSKEDVTRDDSCKKGGLGYLNKCYVLDPSEIDFHTSQKSCQAYGGNLATVNSIHVQLFLTTHVRATTWIGLSNTNKSTGGDNKGQYVYSWTSGDGLHYAAWDHGHTGREQNMCVVMVSAPVKGLWNNVKCEESHPFFCEYPRPGYTTPTPIETTTSLLPCPDGWFAFEQMCYKIVDGSSYINWMQANSACQSLVTGGNLVSITSSQLQSTLSKQARGPRRYYGTKTYWIGLSDKHAEGGYLWASGDIFDYQNWGKGEPNNDNDREDCVVLTVRYNQALWNDAHCYTPQRSYICQAPRGAQAVTTITPPTGVTDSRCGVGWTLYGDYCFILMSVRKNWFDAQKQCHAQKANLASFTNEEENGLITTMLGRRGTNAWIGLNDFDNDVYKWSDGTPVVFISWREKEPNNAGEGERCVEIATDGLWNDIACYKKNKFVCKKKVGSTGAVTVTPPTPPKGGCPLGFYGMSGTKMCYQMVGQESKDRKSYNDAVKACKAVDARLASIHSKIDQEFITTLIAEKPFPVWIGLTAKAHYSKANFHWVDNTKVDYANWGRSQPQRGRNKRCVLMTPDRHHAGSWENVQCYSKMAFICQYRKDEHFATNQPNTEGCPIGYRRFKDSCYSYVSDKFSWADSEAFCNTDGGHLARLRNKFDTSFIEVLLYPQRNMSAWIGLSYSQEKQSFSWTTGWPVLYTNWQSKQPDVTQSCVARTSDGTWKTQDCTLLSPAVCQVDLNPAPFPTGSVPGKCPDSKWLLIGEQCYHVEAKQRRSWPEANMACQAIQGELASIHSATDMEFLANLLTEHKIDAWIGLLKSGETFRWSDETEEEYLNWEYGSPVYANQTNKQACVLAMEYNGKWTDINCFNDHGYICKTKQIPFYSRPPTSTTTTPTTTTISTTTKALTAGEKVPPPTSTTTTPTTTTSKSRLTADDKGLTKGGIAGIVIGSVSLIALVAIITILMRRRTSAPTTSTTNSGFDNAVYDQSKESDANYKISFHKSSDSGDI